MMHDRSGLPHARCMRKHLAAPWVLMMELALRGDLIICPVLDLAPWRNLIIWPMLDPAPWRNLTV